MKRGEFLRDERGERGREEAVGVPVEEWGEEETGEGGGRGRETLNSRDDLRGREGEAGAVGGEGAEEDGLVGEGGCLYGQERTRLSGELVDENDEGAIMRDDEGAIMRVGLGSLGPASLLLIVAGKELRLGTAPTVGLMEA